MAKPGTPTQRAILAEQLRYLRMLTWHRYSAVSIAEQWGLIRGLAAGKGIRLPTRTYRWAIKRIDFARGLAC